MTNKAPLPFPVPQQSATTVGPGYAQTISSSQRLIQITEYVVLTRESGMEYARLFRDSTDAPEFRSCDWYERRDGGPWERTHKDKRKFEPGRIPEGAHCTMIDGIPFYTMHEMTAEEVADHRANLRKLLIRP